MIIIDDFVKDSRLLKEIDNNKKHFFSDNGNYYWWEGWWSSPPNSLKKRLINYLWADNSPYPSVTIGGFEYWTGQFGPDAGSDYLNMHVDKDEALWKETGEISSPIIGTVFYPVPMDIEGGYLEIFTHGEDKEPERIEAKFNRLIIFDAGGTHHRVSKVTKGLRSAIAVNLWAEKPSGELKEEGTNSIIGAVDSSLFSKSS